MSVHKNNTVHAISANHLILLLVLVAMEAPCRVGSNFHQMRSGRNAAAKPQGATNGKHRGTSHSVLGKIFQGKGRRVGSSARNKLMFEADGKCNHVAVLSDVIIRDAMAGFATLFSHHGFPQIRMNKTRLPCGFRMITFQLLTLCKTRRSVLF
jgi:hypothetical protein